MHNKIFVLVVEPEKKPYIKQIDNTLEALQREVGGYIQVAYPWSDEAGLVCDEQGKLDGKPLNRALRDESGNIYDIIAGTFLVVGLGEDDFVSLPNELQTKFYKLFEKSETFIYLNGQLMVLRE